MDPLDELFPEFTAQEKWITARAERFRVVTMVQVEPDHPDIAVSHAAVDVEGTFTRAEAEAKVAELETDGVTAWVSVEREEFHRLLAEYKEIYPEGTSETVSEEG